MAIHTPPRQIIADDSSSIFGKVSCEEELRFYQNDYEEYFFSQAPFNDLVLDPNTYLVVGRRGSGKTSLTQFFNFQQRFPDALHIDIDEPTIYEEVLGKVSETGQNDLELAMKRVVKIWELAIWRLIFSYIEKDASSRESSAEANFLKKKHPAATLLRSVLEEITTRRQGSRFYELPVDVSEDLESMQFEQSRDQALEFAAKRKIIISIDSLERYSTANEAIVRATAALIEAASEFNSVYSRLGIHLKVFVSAEIYPYLSETAISNTLKYIRKPVFLRWRPKDVIRLLCFRLYRHLEQTSTQNLPLMSASDWDNFSIIRDRIWYRYFGKTVVNRRGIKENSFAYVLRHSQMRPRQVVEICNLIAEKAIAEGEFPHFSNKTIVSAIHEKENHLAEEIVNSYSKVYPNIGIIIEALSNMPMMMLSNNLDKLATRTASQWPNGEYDRYRFKQLIAELGIVGKVRHHDQQTGIVEADFEYNISGRLPLQAEQLIVFHPLFVNKLSIKNPRPLVVYPFPDHPEFDEMK